jgi:cell division protein FtsI (penicillin-binding protein 3)
VVTISAALEEKLTRPEEVFDCQMGSIVINGMRIRDSRPHGLLPVWGILAESSDVGAIKIALRLGEDRFYKYIRAFGFGQQTGIELPGETRGLTKPVSRWSKVSIGAISMGQEIGITPLQLSTLVSTIANDGIAVPPRIVAGTTDPQPTSQTVAFHPADERRVISPLTAAQMKQMMQKVVLEGTGKRGPRYSRVFEDQIRCVLRRICTLEQPRHRGRGDPRLSRGSASGRTSFRARVPANRTAGVGVPAYSA